jgi:prepilin signal peptidase PulO-like enzyme (type II secretory pathway)
MAAIAILLSVLLVGIAVVSLRYQLRTWRRLRSGEAIPSDDRRYLRGLLQRRTLNALLMLILAGMLAGAYLSGGQGELERIGELRQQNPPVEPTAEDKEIVKSWAIYWIGVLGLLFFVLMIAMADYLATAIYGRQQLRRIRAEQSTLLERDLAVYRQQKLNDRMRRTN